MRRQSNAKNDSSAPASQTRPKLATARPEPIDEPRSDFAAARDAARLADDYDALRVKIAEFEAMEADLRPRLIAAMKAADKKHFNTMHGRVSLLDATDDKQVADEKAAVALLESRGLPQPPTMEAWLAQHRIPMPMTTKKGMPDRIKFEKND